MPPLGKRSLHQKAVLWAFDSYGDDPGTILVATATEIDCRWEYVSREGIDPNGNLINVTAELLTDQELTRLSIVWLGTEDDLPETPTNLKQVIGYEIVPDIKGRETVRSASLIHYGDTLPETV